LGIFTLHVLTALSLTQAALFAINHNLLNAMGVGHPALTKIVDVSHVRGFSTKLTGAGGGGCAITLVNSDSSPEDIQQLKTELRCVS
jgi:mevalonate kinase